MTQPAYPCSLLCPASRRWLRHQRTTRVRPAEGMGKDSIEIGDKIETIATLPGGWDLAHAIRLGIKPFAELGAHSEALSGVQVDSPFSSRAIFEFGPGSDATVSVFSGFLATGRADRRLQHNPRCQAENDDQPRHWKAQPGGLGPTLRRLCLIGGRVGRAP